ncbi:MAG: methyltransferase domain-containing protein, partial [Planctomycetes bacterium]|nr:methyltransferase domain-containing protein [Planctomycetota bacterium]
YYGQREDSQAYSPTFSRFHERLARDLINRFDLRNKRLIEIGCGKGEFLTLLCKLSGSTGIGFDPAYANRPDIGQTDDCVKFVKDFFSDRYLGCKADFICCKMTLEHIRDVMAFIAYIRRTVDSEKNTIVFFQVPNVIRIFTETAFWDIYYEHCSYFTAFSLRGLFERAGFEVLNTWTDYNDQYLMLQARPGESALERDDQAHETENIHRIAKIFAQKHSLVIARWKRFIEYGPAKRIALWGSGSKAVGFLNTIQSTGRVGCIVDINPYRQKTFSAGTGQPIVSAEFLRSYKPDLVIIINPVYKEEIRDYLDRMNLKPNLMMSTEFV